MRTAYFFPGAGGSLYGGRILGHEAVLAVELERDRCDILEERRGEGWWPGLHVHCGDIRLFDPSPWTGRVDLLDAGWPCTDISIAGSGLGLAGEHSGLWSSVRRGLRILRCAFGFFENSPAIAAGRGLDRVLGDLAEMGYDARWIVLGADSVGAPHQRDRWWCLAYRPDSALVLELQSQGRFGNVGRRTGNVAQEIADSNQELQQGSGEIRQRPANLDERHWWSAEPDVGRMVHGVAHGRNQIEALGDGQVPLSKALAWRLLGGP